MSRGYTPYVYAKHHDGNFDNKYGGLDIALEHVIPMISVMEGFLNSADVEVILLRGTVVSNPGLADKPEFRDYLRRDHTEDEVRYVLEGGDINDIRRDLMEESIASGDDRSAAKWAMKIDGVYDDGILRRQAGFEGGTNPNNGSGGRPHQTSDDARRDAMGWDKDSAADREADRSGGRSGGADADGRREGGSHGSPAQGGNTNSGGQSSGTSHNQQNNRDRQGSGDRTATEDRRPILLDLDGNGVKITEFGNSFQFMAGKDGLQHRTSWAGTGDGVLFYDAGNDNQITEQREYVFTEWNPTAAGDIEAVRSVWDSNGDGKLTAADTEFSKFKVMVTNADGSTSVMTLAQLGITEINLTANATRTLLPDGTTITGQTTFTRQNGTTGTVANTTLTTEADGHRLVEQVGTDGVNRVVTQTGYDADGGVAFRIQSFTSPSGHASLRFYDDNGDGVRWAA